MEAILNFIKEALKGKKMSAQWIVTIAVALAGLTWSATLVWQEYQGMQGKIAELQKVSHKDRPDYDDAPLSGRVTANSDAIINLVLGYLGGMVSAVTSFYFGASQKQE